MKVELIDINLIKPYENNPRYNEEAVEPVRKSLDNFDWQQPIVVDKHLVVIVGHTRLKAALKKGLKQVPVHVADDLTEDEVNAYRLADNKVAELAYWDR